ncbi:MAG: PAS domain-containing protein, partial [Gemmatimonadetes bacterium]|nr:PAS domain-containing protein [Gemmatimonadota bacterium]
MISRSKTRHSDAPEALPNSLSEVVYEKVLENLDVAMAVFGLDGSYLMQNSSHRELLGYSDQELAGKTPAIHLGDEVFTNVAKALESEGRFDGDVVSTTREGDHLQLQLTAFTIYDEASQPMCHVGIKRDVRSVASADDRLMRSVSLLQATLDSTGDGILVVDRAGKI